MDCVLHEVEGVRSYMDDLKTQGENWQQCWAVTIQEFRALIAAGLNINLRKLLVHTCVLLGCRVSNSQISLVTSISRVWWTCRCQPYGKSCNRYLGNSCGHPRFCQNTNASLHPLRLCWGPKGMCNGPRSALHC